jgi:hypothetical protein
LNKEELIKKELDGICKQMEDIQLDINKEKPEVEKLEKLTAEQEELLCK